MTRRDYIALADALASGLIEISSELSTTTRFIQIEGYVRAVMAVAKKLKNNNKRFNEPMFHAYILDRHVNLDGHVIGYYKKCLAKYTLLDKT